jgi:hypothetical protein
MFPQENLTRNTTSYIVSFITSSCSFVHLSKHWYHIRDHAQSYFQRAVALRRTVRPQFGLLTWRLVTSITSDLLTPGVVTGTTTSASGEITWSKRIKQIMLCKELLSAPTLPSPRTAFTLFRHTATGDVTGPRASWDRASSSNHRKAFCDARVVISWWLLGYLMTLLTETVKIAWYIRECGTEILISCTVGRNSWSPGRHSNQRSPEV